MKKTFTVLPIDTPTKNGIIYPKEVMQAAIGKMSDTIKSRKLIGCLEDSVYSERFTMEHASYLVTDIRLEENRMVADIETLDTPKGLMLSEMISAGLVSLTPTGFGTVTDNQVSQFELISISAIPAQHPPLP